MTRTISIWVLFLALFGLLTWFCITQLAPSISQDISERTKASLDTAGYSSVNVTRVDGLHVLLTGVLPSKEQGDAVIALVEKVHGVRSIDAEFVYGEGTIAAPVESGAQAVAATANIATIPNLAPQKPNFSAAHDGKIITISGTVTDASTRASLIGAARRTFTDQRVVDELVEISGMPANWSEQLKQGMTALALLKSGKLDISPSYLSLVGSAQTSQAQQDARQQINRMSNAQQRVRLDVAVLSANSVDANACQSALDRLLASNTIQFNIGSDIISVDSYPLLEELADAIARCENVKVEVQGHTDSSGDAGTNQRLSELRAQSVVNYLLDEGIEGAKLNAVGWGATQPVGDNHTARGRALNRRIEFVTTGR